MTPGRMDTHHKNIREEDATHSTMMGSITKSQKDDTVDETHDDHGETPIQDGSFKDESLYDGNLI